MKLLLSRTVALAAVSLVVGWFSAGRTLRAAEQPSGTAPDAEQVIEFESGGRVHRWVLAPDEVAVIQPGVRSRINRLSATTDVTTLAAFDEMAAEAQAATGTPQSIRERYSLPNDFKPAEYHPVVYPAGHVGSKKYRAVLKPMVHVIVSEAVSLETLQAAAGAREASWVVARRGATLRFDSVVDALAALEPLKAIAGVDKAYPEISGRDKVRAIPNDPLFTFNELQGNYQWHLRNQGFNGGTAGIDVNITDVWDQYRGNGVVISIVDDGLQTFHPDLFLRCDRQNDFDFNGDDDDPDPLGDPLDGIIDTHGTSVAGVSSASWNNNVGGTGAAPESTLIGLRVLGDVFNQSEDDFAQAVGWEEGNIDISNNSWGPGDPTAFADRPLVVAAMQEGVNSGRGGLGRIFCFAAGNDGAVDGNANHSTLTTAPESIAVGAINDVGTRSFYSTPGSCLVISAPSGGRDARQGITTTTLTSETGGYTAEFSGTSSATPLVAGCIALMLEANPNLGWRDVQEILIASARKIDELDPGWITNDVGYHFNNFFGAGMMDAKAAVELAETWTNLGTRQMVEIEESFVTITLPPEGDDGEPTEIGTEIPDTGRPLELLLDASNFTSMRLEHVVLNVDIEHPSREQLELTLISPAGTPSQVLDNFQPADPENTEANIAFDFPLMTVRSWGEEFSGIWRLQIRDTVGGNVGSIKTARLTAYGTTIDDQPPRQLPGLAGDRRFTARLNEFTVIRFFGTPEGSTVSLTGGQLPTGLQFVDEDQVIFGAAEELGEFPLELTVTNGPDSRAFTVVLVVGEPAGSTLAQAIDQTPGSTTSTGLSGPWVVDRDTTFDGSDAAASPVMLPDNFESELRFNNPTAGVMTFAWNISSQENNDRLWFYQAGTPVQNWRAFASGQRQWGRIAVPVTAGLTRWLYRKDGEVSIGKDRAWVDQVTVVPEAEYAENVAAVLGTDQPIRFNGKSYWLEERTVVDGALVNVVRSPSIGNGQQSGVVLDVRGPANIAYDWRVDSAPADLLYLLVNGVVVASIDGATSWRQETIELPFGDHQVEWRYSKDRSFSNGGDGGFLRSIDVKLVSAYMDWLEQNFSQAEMEDPAMRDPDANPDGDAWTNFEEYIFRGRPNIFDNGPLPGEPRVVLGEDGSPIYRFDLPISANDVLVEIQSSVDLENWTDMGIDGQAVDDVLRFEVPVLAGGQTRFVRAVIVPDPDGRIGS